MAVTALIAQRHSRKSTWQLHYVSPSLILSLILSLVCFLTACVRAAGRTCTHYLPEGKHPKAEYWGLPKPTLVPPVLPVKSSGAIWMGVPTMLPDIIASGLQNPKSVILARFCLSSCQKEQVRVTLGRHTQPQSST